MKKRLLIVLVICVMIFSSISFASCLTGGAHNYRETSQHERIDYGTTAFCTECKVNTWSCRACDHAFFRLTRKFVCYTCGDRDSTTTTTENRCIHKEY